MTLLSLRLSTRSNSSYFPVFPSHSFMDLSKEALARSRVSGENLTSLMSCWCPVILARDFLSNSGCHRKRVKSSDPDTSRSGELPWKNFKDTNSDQFHHKIMLYILSLIYYINIQLDYPNIDYIAVHVNMIFGAKH